jgi:hypothetical protein
MKNILIIIFLILSQISKSQQVWKHPSETWDKYKIGTISVSTGCVLVFSAFTFTNPNKIGYSLYGTGVTLSVGGAIYWIVGEQRYYKGKMRIFGVNKKTLNKPYLPML